jgi:hypothetical protein
MAVADPNCFGGLAAVSWLYLARGPAVLAFSSELFA